MLENSSKELFFKPQRIQEMTDKQLNELRNKIQDINKKLSQKIKILKRNQTELGNEKFNKFN